jgi:hypothetical protein
MRKHFRIPQHLLAAIGGTAIAILGAEPVHAQYYPAAPYPAYPMPGYPVAAPVPYAAPAQQPVIMPVGALSGDFRNWGWGKQPSDCAPPCAAPQVAPAPAPMPALAPMPAPEMKAPEPIQPPPAPAPAPVPPMVLQPGEAEQGPALGSASYALATPGMIGDFLGGCSVRSFPVPTSVTASSVSGAEGFTNSTTVNGVSIFAAVPDLAFGAFKVAENESPIPRDRVFAYYNHYTGVLGVVEGSTLSTATLPPDTAGNSFPALTYTGNTIRFDVYREVIGFEKTFFDGQASVELRVPFFQTGGIPVSTTGVSTAPDGSGDTFNAPINSNLDAESNVGDMTVVLKYAPYLNRDTGNAVAVGLAVTIPTGPTIPTANGNANCWLFQPYVGFLYNFGTNWYAEGYSSVAIPTNSNTDLLLFEDIGVGYWLYQGNSFLTGIVPTVEFHANIAPNDKECIGYNTNELDITAGVHAIFNRRAILTLAGSIPVSGPLPYTFEGIIQLNYMF